MLIVVAADHAGFLLKEEIKDWLSASGYAIEDIGTHSSDSCDYPLLAERGAQIVAKSSLNRGIFVCGSGHGMAVVSNKISGIRAVNAREVYEIENARRDGDVNVLTLGGRVTVGDIAIRIVEAFLETDFDPEKRYRRRLDQIKTIEKEN